MQDLSSIALAQAGGPSELDGFIALFAVQLTGVVIAFILAHRLKRVYCDEFPEKREKQIQYVVMFLGLITLIIGFLHGEIPSLLWVSITKNDNFRLDVLTMKTALWIYFLADFAALAFVIRWTGGPEKSVFSAFLFVLVPITMALGRGPGWEIVVTFALISVAIFVFLLCAEPAADLRNLKMSGRSSRRWLGIITSVCVALPTSVYCAQVSVAATGTPKVENVDERGQDNPPGAESNPLLAQRGGVDGAASASAADESLVTGSARFQVR